MQATWLMKRQLRDLQTYAPWLRSMKFGLYNLSTRYFGWRIDPDFYVLRHFTHIRQAIDVGGNWGQSIEAIKRLCPEANIVSFEPNPILSHRLKKKYYFDKKVRIESAALSSKLGEMKLFIPRYRRFIYDGLASLNPEEAEGWLNKERVANFDRSKLSLVSFDVKVCRLDDFCLSPDFLKIDVQGHELSVLYGAENTLKANPLTLIEGANPEIVEFMKNYCMQPYSYFRGILKYGDFSGVNTLFMTEKQARNSGIAID